MRPGKAKGPSTSTGAGGAPPVVPSYIIGTSKRIVFADSPYTVLATDTTLLCDTSGGNIVLQLPAIAVMGDRVVFAKMDIGAGSVSILPNGVETIDGAASYGISVLNESVALQGALAVPSDKWQALARYSEYRSNDYTELWTGANGNWTYDGQEDFTTYPGYFAAGAAFFSAGADFNPLPASFNPFPRTVTGPFPLHINQRVRSLTIGGVNTALVDSYFAQDALLTLDWVNLIWASIDLAGQNEYTLEVNYQKNGVNTQFIYQTGIPITADREDDIDTVIYPDHVECYFNGMLVFYDSGFAFTDVSIVFLNVQRMTAARQGMLHRAEIFTQAPNR